MKEFFGDNACQFPISSAKAVTGHLLGSASAVEATGCIKIIQESMSHVAINHECRDPDCDLDYVPRQPPREKATTLRTDSFGSGGHDACLVLREVSD